MGQTASGLGRNGPWLQNDWLRVETRLDDASISPVALQGSFRPTERGLAAIEVVDAPELVFGRAEYDVRPIDDAIGHGRLLSLVSRDARRAVTLRREVAMYDARPYCVTRVGVTNSGHASMRIAALRPFVTPMQGRGRLQLRGKPETWRMYANGWQSWSPTMSFGGADRGSQSAPPVLAAEPPQEQPGVIGSHDVGVLFDPASGRALLAGAISARDFITMTAVDAPARSLDVRCLADGVELAPGETVWSERVLVDVCDGPLEQLERYGEALGLEMGARVPDFTPSGWCSWYYFFTEVTEDDVVRNLRFLEKHRRELPIDTVQIDDGYQADIGDWLTVNDKFPRGMRVLATEIKAAGYRPGIWLAPFLLAETSKTYAEHPEWIVRTDDGSPALANYNWQRNNWGIDGSHPGALAWLRDLFREVCDGWGYEYVKIDFLFGAAIAGRRQDPRATRLRAYRQALGAVREGVGGDRFILGCGSLMAPSVGYFDGNRIGLDVAPFWRFLTTEERARPAPRPRLPDDILSAEGAIRNTLNRSWMHGRLWANDPDCVLVRTDRTKLSLDEVRTLATAIGLSGGMALASDDLEKVPPERLEILSMLLPVLPYAARPVDLMLRDMPERFEFRTGRPSGPEWVIAAFNFDDEARDLSLDLPEGEWHAFELWEERYAGVRRGSMEFALVAPHACRVVALTPLRLQPCVVATTAHIGMGTLDISSEEWDPGSRTLRVGVELAGRQRRLVVVDPAGRTLERAEFAGDAVQASTLGAVIAITIEVDESGELTLSFA